MRTQAIEDCRYCPDPRRVAATSGTLTVHVLAFLALMIPISAIEIPKLKITRDEPKPNIDVTLYPPERVKAAIPSPKPPQPTDRVRPTPTPVTVPVPVPIPVPPIETPYRSVESAHPIEPIPFAPPAGPSDVPLVPRSMPKPVYPRAELGRGIEGETVVWLRVDRAGVPVLIRLERSSGNPNLDRAALDAARRWRFEPALQNGAAVEVETTVPVKFSILSG